MGAVWTTLAVLALGVAAWGVWSAFEITAAGSAELTPTPVQALQQDLLHENVGRPGDPRLSLLFHDMSVQYFGGQLPAIPVRWEPDLARVGPLVARQFALKGMFGTIGSRSVILLNPDLGADSAALKRALAHEMVHAYLTVTGDSSTDHGPAFQAVLQRLSREGAFEGIAASGAEREQLHAWLDAESARLDAERKEMDQFGADINAERGEIERALAKPDRSAEATAALTARLDAYNQRAVEANDRSERDRADVEHFNHEVERYNLMLVYPDGMDVRAQVSPKSHQDSEAPRALGRQ
jgi:hypothetical protein